MDINTARELLEWDRNLQVGDVVELRWTNCYNAFSAPARVTKLNRQTLRAALLQPVPYPGFTGYEAGREISVPRYANFTQHTNANGAHKIS